MKRLSYHVEKKTSGGKERQYEQNLVGGMMPMFIQPSGFSLLATVSDPRLTIGR